jgi:hypothetical protein
MVTIEEQEHLYASIEHAYARLKASMDMMRQAQNRQTRTTYERHEAQKAQARFHADAVASRDVIIDALLTMFGGPDAA